MTDSWTREALAARVGRLREEHEGGAFVDAVRRFADELDDASRELLGAVLLAEAAKHGAYEYALRRRAREPRWKLFRRAVPDEPGRPPRR